ncbi:MAG: sigma-70 family RNA polymerase sigma factor [Bradymonadales bacterium]|nr:sigma-70 family RNA polymerase sigma factor [Bradymonadales bacterium]
MGIDVESCYRRYGPMVFRRCQYLLGDERQAEDAMQDVFANLLARQERFDARGLASLLYRMATLTSLNYLRRQRRHPEDRREQLLLSIAAAEELESSTISRRLLEALFGAERTSTRVMAALHFVDGWSLEEVAREARMSVSGVRKRLRQLKSRLVELEGRP